MSESKDDRLRRFVVRVRWHARKAGGLFIGVRVSFPVSILFDNGEVRPTIQVNVGLLIATLDMEIRGRVTHTHNAPDQARLQPSPED